MDFLKRKLIAAWNSSYFPMNLKTLLGADSKGCEFRNEQNIFAKTVFRIISYTTFRLEKSQPLIPKCARDRLRSSYYYYYQEAPFCEAPPPA